MKKYRYVIALILCFIILVQSGIGTWAAEVADETESADTESDEETDEELKEYLKKAGEELNALASEENLMALVYLCETYHVRKTPDSTGETVVQIPSGATVFLEGMGMDADYNIWYQVSFEQSGSTYTGYIEREYLAYSNELFINWENTYFPKAAMFAAERSIYPDVEQFPASYQQKLIALKQAHPNWIFVKQNTGLNWQKVVKNENYKDRNLISSSMGAAYRGEYYGPGWYYASEEAVKYYLDPRNFLNDTRVFQFEQLTYNSSYHSRASVQNILNNTFMKGDLPGSDMTYADAFYQIGVSLKVSPFHLACRVYQEQGAGTSALISGNYDAVPEYRGYYNYYNIGASGSTIKQVVESGLAKAVAHGWNTPYASIKGGAEILSKNYILRGQDTLYLQKFDVDASDGTLYTHQYMQNIMAPYSESYMVKDAYTKTGSLDSTFVFKIPVYNNMPSEACPVPSKMPEPTVMPTATPTVTPTATPTVTPTATPTVMPTATPTVTPTAIPTATVKPIATPTATAKETATPTATAKATATPTATAKATAMPTATAKATATPTATVKATAAPVPTAQVTAVPTVVPTAWSVENSNTEKSSEGENQSIVGPTTVSTPSPEIMPKSENAGEDTLATGNVEEDKNSSGVTVTAVTPKPQTEPENKDVLTLDMRKTDMIYAQTLQQLKEQERTVILEMDDKISWRIDGRTIESNNIEDVNLKVSLGESQIPDRKLEVLTENEDYIEMSLEHDGEFGFTAVLSVEIENAQYGQYANLFYYNKETENFEFMCASQISSKGRADFEFKHASDYVIIVSDDTKEGLLEAKADQMADAEVQAAQVMAQSGEELPAKEPGRAAGIIALILLASTALVIGVYLIFKKSDDE